VEKEISQLKNEMKKLKKGEIKELKEEHVKIQNLIKTEMKVVTEQMNRIEALLSEKSANS